MRNASVQIA